MDKPIHTPTTELMMADFYERVQSNKRNSETCVHEDALAKVMGWKALGSCVVANAGAFDLLSLNHIRGLIQCRIIGAMCLAGVKEIEFGSSHSSEVIQLAASDEVRLIVSIDTNQAIEDNKSLKPKKGNVIKPILDWDTRAMMVASQSMPIPGTSTRRQVADYITRHGPSACLAHENCWHEDSTFSLASLDPDILVRKEDPSIKQTRVYDSKIVVIDEHDNAFVDRLINDEICSTNIAKRIKS